jgi:hypothetical protein
VAEAKEDTSFCKKPHSRGNSVELHAEISTRELVELGGFLVAHSFSYLLITSHM